MPRKKKIMETTPDTQTAVPKKATRRQPTKDKPGIMEEVIIQYAGAEWSIADLKEKALTSYVAEGHRRGNVKKIVLYVKPEEHKAYYVINDNKAAGHISFE